MVTKKETPTATTTVPPKKEIFTYEITNGEALLLTCDDEQAGELVIPDTLGGCPVTAIADGAFNRCTKLTTVRIPSSVRHIGISAFWRCSALTSVTIPEGVTTIGECAFELCTSLKTVTLPASVTAIGNEAFNQCSALEVVNVPDLTLWCAIAFGEGNANPLRLRDARLRVNGAEIGGDVVIGSGAKTIPYGTFKYNASAVSVTAEPGLTTVEEYAFAQCAALKSVTLPDGVTYIGKAAFTGCPVLETAVLGHGIDRIQEKTFYGCSALTSVTFTNSVKSVGDSAFRGCTAMRTTYFIGTSSEWAQIIGSEGNSALFDRQRWFYPNGIPKSE